jgi:hypothetical protein
MRVLFVSRENTEGTIRRKIPGNFYFLSEGPAIRVFIAFSILPVKVEQRKQMK